MIIDLGANRQHICDFLLVIDMDVSRVIFEMLTHKARKWLFSPTAPLFNARAQGNRLEFLGETYPAKTRKLYGENCILQPFLTDSPV